MCGKAKPSNQLERKVSQSLPVSSSSILGISGKIYGCMEDL